MQDSLQAVAQLERQLRHLYPCPPQLSHIVRPLNNPIGLAKNGITAASISKGSKPVKQGTAFFVYFVLLYHPQMPYPKKQGAALRSNTTTTKQDLDREEKWSDTFGFDPRTNAGHGLEAKSRSQPSAWFDMTDSWRIWRNT